MFTSFLFSCRANPKISNNEFFESKYKEQVVKVNSDRIPQKQPSEQEFRNYQLPSEQLNADNFDYNENKVNYEDIMHFAEQRNPKKYLPDIEVYEQNHGNNPSDYLPPNIFEISYNLELNPPFRKIGMEFDLIDIPDSDAYGIHTATSEKSYLLPDKDSLQTSIALIKSQRTSKDIELSIKLINEKKLAIQKQKMQIFSDDKNSLSKFVNEEKIKLEKLQKKPSDSKKNNNLLRG